MSGQKSLQDFDIMSQKYENTIGAVGVLRLTHTGIVQSADTSAKAMLLNLKQNDPVGKPLAALVPWQDSAPLVPLLAQAGAGRGATGMLGVCGPDQVLVRLTLTLLPLPAAEGILCSMALLPHQPPAPQQHDPLRLQATTVLDGLSKGIQILAKDGTLLYQNVAAERLLGLPLDARDTAQAHDISHHHRADGSVYPLQDCPICLTVADGLPRHVVDEVFFRRDGTAFPVEYSVVPVPADTAAGSDIGAIVSFRDVSDRKLEDALREIEPEILELMAQPDRLDQGLDLVTQTVDRMFPAYRSAVMRAIVDATAQGRLRFGSAPGLPAGYVQAMQTVPVAEGAGSCGTAAFRKRMVIVADTATDPLWQAKRDIAAAHGLAACFSVPVIGLSGEVLATFALYADHICYPSAQDTAIMARVATFLRHVFERAQHIRALRDSEARYEEIFNLVPVSIWEYDATAELALLRDLRAQGVGDLAAYFDSHPEVVAQAFALHRVRQVNARALTLYGANSLQELSDGFRAAATSDDFKAAYRGYLLALASGQPHFVAAGTVYRLDGTPFRILTEMSLPQGDSTRVLMAELDITAQDIAERRFRTIVQTTSSAIFDHDLRTDEFWWSEGLRATFGHSPEDLASGTVKWAELVHPDDLQKTVARVQKARSSPDNVTRASYRFRRANGSYAYVEARARVLFDAAGKPERTIGSLVDVTDRAMAEERFRIVAENTSDVVFETNWSNDRIWWSEGFRTSFGHDPATAAHDLAAFLELVHPDDRAPLQQSIAGSHRHPEGRLRTEFRLRRADGSYADVEVRARMAFDTANTAGRVVGALIDITERKAIEERLHMAVKVTSDVVWDQDLITDEIWWSDGLSDKLGIERAALSPVPEIWHKIIHPDDQPAATKSFRDAVNGTAETWTYEYRLRRADGQYITIRDTARILRDRAGRAYRAVGAIVDLTQTRLLEQQVQRVQRLETIGQLSGGIAHDFNNLLAIVMGSADLLLARLPPDSDTHEMANMILAAAERGAALTERLLAFGRKRSLSQQVTAPAEVITALKPMLQRTLGPMVTVRLDLAAPPLVLLDVGQFENALINLSVNARDAMPPGGTLTISAKAVSLGAADKACLPELAAGPHLLVTVTDSGEGMSPETLSHVFEPFFTTKTIGSGKNMGTGLGLPTIHGFMRQSGGAIRITSDLGKGTSVQLYFPASPASPASAALAVPPATAPHPEDDLTPLHGHILVVDDDDLVRAQTRQSLTRLGCEVTEAGSARQALALLESLPPVDLVMTDIMMPGGMDGRQLAARIASLYPALPVLLTTGYSKGLTDDPALPPILFKPYRLSDLKRRLMTLLRKSAD